MEQTESRAKRETEEEGDNDAEEEQQQQEAKTKKTTMTPWEQHSAVISIPRFDYDASSSLLRRSHSGSLITCTIKREKSATKEAMCLLEKYCGAFTARKRNNLEVADAKLTAKRRKVCPEELDRLAGKLSGDVSSQTKEAMRAKKSPAF